MEVKFYKCFSHFIMVAHLYEYILFVLTSKLEINTSEHFIISNYVFA